MKLKKCSLALLLTPLFVLFSCEQSFAIENLRSERTCDTDACAEAEMNAPAEGFEHEADERPEVVEAYKEYDLPAFSTSWGLRRGLYDKASSFYRSQQGRISNSRYLTIIDMKMHSSKKRFYLFDLATGKVERNNTSHGEGSDPDKDGNATQFSNVNDSHKTSLGFYITLGTYTGKNGHSLRLRGLESSNSNAEKRAIVVHPANYVSNASGRTGLSWGCPAVDPKVSRKLIDRIKGGSLFLIDY